MAKFLLVFDIPRELNTLRNRIHRKLIKFDIRKIQNSVWASQNARLLVSMAKEIRKEGASAKVFEIKRVKG